MKKELPFSLKLIQGAIGKDYVIKHYKDGAVKTKYPDMSGIIATTHQRKCRNLFKEAVAYAKVVIADNDRKACWQRKLRKRNSVYNTAIKEYMLRAKKEKEKQFIEINRLLMVAMNITINKNEHVDHLTYTPVDSLKKPIDKIQSAKACFQGTLPTKSCPGECPTNRRQFELHLIDSKT